MQVLVAEGCGPTGRLLSKLLASKGAKLDTGCGREAVVCWGRGYNGPHPALNGKCGRFNKLEQLERLAAQNVPALRVFRNAPEDQDEYPLIARRLHHVAGRDIIVCLQPSDAAIARSRGANFFTQFEPRRTEYRVWIYRRRHLGTYEKVLLYPERYKRFGCNYKNGFAFRLVTAEHINRAVVDVAARAVDALELDFGAVDILLRVDGTPLVLEVNTAPGVEGEDRQVIRALADKVVKWQELKFPRRNGDTNGQQ